MNEMKIKKKEFWFAACFALIFLFFCDAVLRRVLPPVYQSTKYGWTAPEETVRQSVVEDSPGKFRKVTAEYFKNGFKRWGDVRSKRTKMLIIGDSFTAMHFVSNGEEWYSYLEKGFKDLELFVYGGEGYGSLAEYMILDEFIDEIRPQLILIQFCPNDYDNNLYDLDLLNYPYNNHAIRPYWEKGGIVYRLPLPFANLRARSFIADRVLAVYDRFVWEGAVKDLDGHLAGKQQAEQQALAKGNKKMRRLQEESAAVTKEIFAMIGKRAGGAVVYLLNPGDDPFVEDLCRANGFSCIRGVEKELMAEEKKGFATRVVNNGHWNYLGNKIVGQKVVEHLKGIHGTRGFLRAD